MIVLRADDSETLFLLGLQICKDGFQVAPRGLHTIEARESVAFELLNPARNLVTNPYRKLNYTFGLFESIAMWNGINDVEAFAFYNKKMAEFSDDGITFFGSYGEEFVNQLSGIISLLDRDRDSRQAVITLWRKNPPRSKDIPCTVMLHFIVRDFHLNLNIYMRSNDIWLGFPYDITNFSRIQQALASVLNFRVGILRYIAGSLHMYSGDIYKSEFALRYNGPRDIEVPLCTFKDLVALNSTARKIRTMTGQALEPVTDFEKMHTSLLHGHGMAKLGVPTEWPEPYRSLVGNARKVHRRFKDSEE